MALVEKVPTFLRSTEGLFAPFPVLNFASTLCEDSNRRLSPPPTAPASPPMRPENASIAGNTDALWTSSKTQDKTMLMAPITPSSVDDPKSAVNKSPDVVTDEDEAAIDQEELELIEVEDEEEEEVIEAEGCNEDAEEVTPAGDDQGEDLEYVYEEEDNEVNDEEEEIIEEVLSDEEVAPENIVEDDSSEYSGDDMGGDSTHVAISGLEQSGVERVDLEKLKPKSPERASPKPSLSSLEPEVSEEVSNSLVYATQAVAEEVELPTTPIASGSKSVEETLSAPEPQVPPAPAVFEKQVNDPGPSSPLHPKAPPSYSSLPVEPQLLAQASAEVQADSVVGPSSPLAWEKPAWTKAQLRSTPAGDAVKQGANLASPITHIRKTVNAASMMNGFVGSPMASPKRQPHPASSPPLSGGNKNLDWQKPTWVAAKLRPTEKGVLVKTKGDLQRPITNVEKNGIDSINVEANPMGLRPTDRGSQVRLGATLAAPITHFGKSPMADVNFEANPDLILHATELGDVVKQGSSLAAPVTNVNQEKNAARDVNPVANPTVLRKTELGDVVKTVGDLQAPITHVERDRLKDINLEANPMVLKPTDKGCKIRLGDDLSGPITTIASKKNPLADVNFEANPDLILQPTPLGRVVKRGNSLAKPVTHVNVEKDAARDVNFVANPALLRRTDLGEIVKTKGDLQKPITHVEKDSLDDINFEANPMILRPTTKGCLLRIGEDLARPITHIARNRTAEIDDFLGHSNSSGVEGSDPEDDDRLS